MSVRIAIGDVVVIVAATIVGFITHNTIGDVPRLLWTLAVFLIAWFWAAALMRIYSTRPPVWRVVAAWSLAAPLGAVVRALILNIPITPIFVVVTIAVTGAALGLWRALARRLGIG